MLRKLRLTDFKSFVDEEVELAPLTLLVGANASGKSNFLDAIRFLQGAAAGLNLGEILDGEEWLRKEAWPPLRSSLESSLRSIRSLNIKPSEMRGYGRRGHPLGAQGQNVSGVLRDLSDSADEKRSVMGWLAELCAPEIVDLDFLEVKELGDVMAMFVEKGGRRISARSISDGTLHFLGTLLALRTAEPGSILLIEEIETGLHPTRIRLLVEYLESVTRERNIQVIATTHSPGVLQWLSDESLRSTIVFGRVPDREGTIMRRIGDLPHFDEVIQRKGIDELFTTGWLEMAL